MLLLLLLSGSGSVHPNPGPALLAVSQPNFELSIRQVKPVITPADGHCLLHSVSSSIYNYLHLLVHLSSIIEHTSRGILAYSNEYTPF